MSDYLHQWEMDQLLKAIEEGEKLNKLIGENGTTIDTFIQVIKDETHECHNLLKQMSLCEFLKLRHIKKEKK